MKPKRGRIIKRHEIEITGSVLLEADSTIAAISETDSHTGHPAHVRLVEQQADGAILEVTCGCSRTIRIRCDYAKSTLVSSAPI